MSDPGGSDDLRDADAETVRSGSVQVSGEDDILRARQTAREVAEEMDFGLTDVTRIVTAVSELARNVHLYTDGGEMRWRKLDDGGRRGLELTFEDDGPGIDDVEGVLRGEHSTSEGMGRGVQGTRELVDEFALETGDSGTTVRIRKWQR